jgi:hypothetical protein
MGQQTVMKKQPLKYTLKEIITIVFFWLLALSMVYIVYLKIKLLHHNQTTKTIIF